MTYLALVEEAVRRHSPSDWDRLQLFPVTVDTFLDHTESERSKISMLVGECVASVNKYIRVMITVPRAPAAPRRSFNEVLMAGAREQHLPKPYTVAQDEELQYPEKVFNEISAQLGDSAVGVRTHELAQGDLEPRRSKRTPRMAVPAVLGDRCQEGPSQLHSRYQTRRQKKQETGQEKGQETGHPEPSLSALPTTDAKQQQTAEELR